MRVRAESRCEFWMPFFVVRNETERILLSIVMAVIYIVMVAVYIYTEVIISRCHYRAVHVTAIYMYGCVYR